MTYDPIDTGAGDNQADRAVTLDQANIGNGISGPISNITWDRPEVNKTATTVQVPGDESTIQDALRKVPRRLVANYTIEIDETASDFGEDIIIPPVQSEDLGNATQGSNSRLIITRQGASGYWTTSSVYGVAGRGQASCMLKFAECDGVNPYDNEDAVYAFYGWDEAVVHDCKVIGSARSGTSVGILSYASNVKQQQDFDYGTNLVSVAGKVKHMGQLLIGSTSNTISGSVTGDAYEQGSGHIVHNGKGPLFSTRFIDQASSRNGWSVSRQIPVLNESGPTEFDVIFVQADGDVELRDSDGAARIKLFDGSAITFENGSGTEVARIRGDGVHDFQENQIKDVSHDDTDDSMTADPETAQESGYIEINIGGTTRQIPFYDA